MAVTRQQLEQQLVAAHRTKNVQAAQQAAYAIRAYDQNVLSAQVPSINAPPPIERVPKPTFGDYFEDISRGMGRGFVTQLEGMQQLVTHPYDTGKALIQAGVEAVRNPSQAIGEAWSGIKSQAQTAMSSPEGFGRVLGENLDFIPGPNGKRRPTMAELDVYHGTPHTFEPEEGAPLGRFRSSKIGTGEGAQKYGYGLYFAESPGTAKTYQINLSSGNDPRDWIHEVATILGKDKRFGQQDIVNELRRYEQTSALADNPKIISLTKRMAEGYEWSKTGGETWTNDALRAIKQLDADLPKPPAGRFYKVDLPDAKIEQMLDWDKPLSEQPQLLDALRRSKNKTVQSVMAQIGDPSKPIMSFGQDLGLEDGQGLMRRLSYALDGKPNSPKASALLQKLGVPGVRYLDAGSRAGEKGTRNFVVFPGEEQNLTILERDGVKAEVPKPDELAYHGTTKQAAAAIEREGFDLTRAADGTVWFTSNPNIGEVAATGKGGIVSRSVSGLKLGGWDEMDKYSTDELIAKGYDGLRLKDGDEITYQIFNPEKLKVPTKKAK